MSRMAANDPVVLPPSSFNVYTALAAAGMVGVALGVLVLLMRAHTLGLELFKM